MSSYGEDGSYNHYDRYDEDSNGNEFRCIIQVPFEPFTWVKSGPEVSKEILFLHFLIQHFP